MAALSAAEVRSEAKPDGIEAKDEEGKAKQQWHGGSARLGDARWHIRGQSNAATCNGNKCGKGLRVCCCTR